MFISISYVCVFVQYHQMAIPALSTDLVLPHPFYAESMFLFYVVILKLPPPTVPSPSSPHLHCPSTSTFVFLLLFPSTSILVTLFPTYSPSLLVRCPYQFYPLSLTFLDISPTFVVPLNISLLILSIFITLHISTSLFLSRPTSSPVLSFFFPCLSPIHHTPYSRR